VVEHPIVLAAIVAAFVIFGVTLAYVDWIASRRPHDQPAE
jgi:hypothetical protein